MIGIVLMDATLKHMLALPGTAPKFRGKAATYHFCPILSSVLTIPSLTHGTRNPD